jgi:uncharacterized membrane protein YhaH (DUF805 family)
MSMRAESLVPVYGFGIAAGVILLWGQLGVCIKRLHDRGKSGWWLLIFWALPAAISQAGEASTDFNLRIAAAVPIGVIWLWAVLELGCLRGTEGPTPTAPIRCRRGADARLSLSYSDVMLAGLAIASRVVR